MSSTILRIFLGTLLVLGLAFPAAAMAGEGDSDQASDNTQFLNVTSANYQAEDTATPQSPMDEEIPAQSKQGLGTILNYTLYGGGIGTLVGFAGYVISGFDWTPWTIAGFAGGGALLGAGLETYRVMSADQDRMSAQSVEYMKRDVPKAVELPVMKLQF